MSKSGRRHKLRRPRIRRRTKPGAAPGTVKVDPAAPKSVLSVIGYDGNHLEENELAEPRQIRDYLGRYGVTWIDVDGLGDLQMIYELGDVFQLHPLALEDVVNVHQRAKVEEYDDHLYIVFRMVPQNEQGVTEQVSLFLGRNYVLTFQEREGDCFDPVRIRLRKNRGPIRNNGPDYLAYALLDAVIDSYFPLVDRYADRLDQLEDMITRDRGEEPVQQLHDMRGDLLVLRRSVRPHREAVNSLIRDEHELITEKTRYFLRDVYDHAVQLNDLLDTYREVSSDLRDYYLSKVSNRMNEIMKVLTIIATIFIPLSFIAGVYGMNFDTSSPWNLPELGWRFGYPVVWMLMGSVAVVMLAYFRRKGWIGRFSKGDERADEARGE